MTREQVLAELEAAAKSMDDKTLTILGVEIDKSDARQVYGALCWIEQNALVPLRRGGSDAG
jgi:hypothetical protein